MELFIIAWDGLAIIVHPSTSIDELSLEAVRRIFAGQIISWEDVGGPHRNIHVVSRKEGSGTRGAFQEMLMGKERITKMSIVQDSNGPVREIVAGDPYAIGYISLGLLEERFKAIKPDGIEPCLENIVNRNCQVVDSFIFVINGPPSGEVHAFIQFILSSEGQELIQRQGLIPSKLVMTEVKEKK